ncbi:MD-2-related lipid-recognition domain-containing protein [Aphelenchoides bicaudatus]|nr:MD-2-related lipid-recognition domain-containing protein [Aphelenchoides bicaudatus]
MRTFLFLLALCSSVLAAPPNMEEIMELMKHMQSMPNPNCEKFPNGTDSKANWYMCDDVKNDGTIYDMKFQDTATNKDEYPIQLKKPLNVVMDIKSPGTYSSINLDIDIYSWGGWSGCSWHKVPTFGLLNNLDACSNGVPCPIQSGRHTITINLDFSKYSSIIGLLTDDSPYQLHYKLTDNKSKKATCAIVQARAKTK